MILHHAFAGKTRVEQIKGKQSGRRGLVVEVNHQTGRFKVVFDSGSDEWCDPAEFNSLPKRQGEKKSGEVNQLAG